jgi:hypothetical protein
MSANTDPPTPGAQVVSETSTALTLLVRRLSEAASRYADAAVGIDTPGPEQAALLWQLEKDLESLGEIVHVTRRRLRTARMDRGPGSAG